MRTTIQPRFDGTRSSVALKDFATGLGFGFMAGLREKITLWREKSEIGMARMLPGGASLAAGVVENEGGGHTGACPSANGTRAKPASAALGVWLGRLCSGAFGEAGDGFGFRVVHIEDGQQLGDLEDFLELAAHHSVKTQGASLRLCHLGSKFQEVLQITKLLTVFDVYNTEAEAVASFSKGAGA